MKNIMRAVHSRRVHSVRFLSESYTRRDPASATLHSYYELLIHEEREHSEDIHARVRIRCVHW